MRKPTSLGGMAMLAALMAGPAMGMGSGWGHYTGRSISRNPQPRNLDNRPDRAKGMREFWVKDGAIVWQPGDPTADPNGATLVWAGTPKAALKKARLLELNSPTP